MAVPTVIASNNEDEEDKLADNMEDLLKLSFEII